MKMLIGIIKSSGLPVKIYDVYKSDGRLIANCMDNTGKRYRIPADGLEVYEPEKVVPTNSRSIVLDSDYNTSSGMSRNMRSATNQVKRDHNKDDGDVERYRGVMIYSHKTGAEIEIKQGDKLIKAAGTFSYKNKV
jgi:hypothetical protein